MNINIYSLKFNMPDYLPLMNFSPHIRHMLESGLLTILQVYLPLYLPLVIRVQFICFIIFLTHNQYVAMGTPDASQRTSMSS
jgi:hypothetical protein